MYENATMTRLAVRKKIAVNPCCWKAEVGERPREMSDEGRARRAHSYLFGGF